MPSIGAAMALEAERRGNVVASSRRYRVLFNGNHWHLQVKFGWWSGWQWAARRAGVDGCGFPRGEPLDFDSAAEAWRCATLIEEDERETRGEGTAFRVVEERTGEALLAKEADDGRD